jgi:hypothetical protein
MFYAVNSLRVAVRAVYFRFSALLFFLRFGMRNLQLVALRPPVHNHGNLLAGAVSRYCDVEAAQH